MIRYLLLLCGFPLEPASEAALGRFAVEDTVFLGRDVAEGKAPFCIQGRFLGIILLLLVERLEIASG